MFKIKLIFVSKMSVDWWTCPQCFMRCHTFYYHFWFVLSGLFWLAVLSSLFLSFEMNPPLGQENMPCLFAMSLCSWSQNLPVSSKGFYTFPWKAEGQLSMGRFFVAQWSDTGVLGSWYHSSPSVALCCLSVNCHEVSFKGDTEWSC